MTSPLAAAARAFSEVCDLVDGVEIIDERLKIIFSDTHEELQYRTDKRIFFARELKIRQEAVASAIELYKAEAMYLEQIEENFKAIVQAEVESAPNVEFRGKLGKIWVQANTPGVDYKFGENRPRKADALLFAGVPEDFIKDAQLYMVDGERVLAALQSGETFPWARRKPERGVRFSPMRKPKLEGAKNVSPTDD